MKNTVTKRLLALLLAMCLIFGLAACGERDDDDDKKNTSQSGNKGNKGDDPAEEPSEPTKDPVEDPEQNVGGENSVVQADELSDDAMRYVMIYNPKVYNEDLKNDKSSLNLGELGSQVDVDANRGDGLETETEHPFTSISQLEWQQYLPDGIKIEENRADVMGTDYEEGDTQKFYCSTNLDPENRRKKEYTCVYAGENCYIWALEDEGLRQSTIDKLGEEFDETIYPGVSEVFGEPRFVGDAGKVNLLLNEMSGNLLGSFALVDLFTEAELPEVGLEDMTCNTGHAILNINSLLLENSSYRDMLYSTAAHELQHLINSSALFETTDLVWMNVWLNEGMSGYIETELYENAKEESGHYDEFNDSDLIRNGQSLYNFTTNRYDIGVYGSVYYFAKYLEEVAGEEIFTDIMDYWRDSYSETLSTAEALAESMPKSAYKKINNSVDYAPLKLKFADDSEEFMSKLTLNFYLETLANELDIDEFENIDQNDLLYDSIDGAKIEGGGRLIVALSDDTFEIPSDSDDGLIYVGLDEDFKPVTEFVYK